VKDKIYKIILNLLRVALWAYVVVMLLGIVGVFINNIIPNTKIIFLLLKVIIAGAALRFLTFIKKETLPKKARRFTKQPQKTGFIRTTAKIVLIVFVFSTLGFYSPNREIHAAVGSAKFNILGWEINALLSQLAYTLTGSVNLEANTQKEQVLLVAEYFELVKSEQMLSEKAGRVELTNKEIKELEEISQRRKAIQNEVELIISDQIQSVVEDLGIYNPLNGGAVFFPPMLFKFELPPKLLTISYRDRLELNTTILLKPDLSIEEIERVEERIESLGFSAYTRQSTGISLFPTIVYPDSLQNRLRTIAHEWLHTYIVFTPLGFARFKANTSERQTIEETVASIFGNEIGAEVWKRFYLPYLTQITPAPPAPRTEQEIATFNRNEFLIETRQQVEKLLEAGKIEEAEAYMKQRRDELEENGYWERKINQAYFVANGYYATNPIYQGGQGGLGEKLLELREKTDSLAEFIKIVIGIKNLQDLEEALQKLR